MSLQNETILLLLPKAIPRYRGYGQKWLWIQIYRDILPLLKTIQAAIHAWASVCAEVNVWQMYTRYSVLFITLSQMMSKSFTTMEQKNLVYAHNANEKLTHCNMKMSFSITARTVISEVSRSLCSLTLCNT